ncbi:MAG: class I SAM-dependent methyltransferase [Gammaproteobacteria bacterium]|nr:class I SAM-dependent methyltransferase [Gammaproteobacteria bacterium]
MTGIDLSKGMPEKAWVRVDMLGLSNINLQQMDMKRMDLPGEHFDIINVSFGIFFVERI